MCPRAGRYDSCVPGRAVDLRGQAVVLTHSATQCRAPPCRFRLVSLYAARPTQFQSVEGRVDTIEIRRMRAGDPRVCDTAGAMMEIETATAFGALPDGMEMTSEARKERVGARSLSHTHTHTHLSLSSLSSPSQGPCRLAFSNRLNDF